MNNDQEKTMVDCGFLKKNMGKIVSNAIEWLFYRFNLVENDFTIIDIYIKYKARNQPKNYFTRKNLAEIMGVAQQTNNTFNKEKFDRSLPTAFRISTLFKLPIEAIFYFEEK